jgi:hypothetical protein
MTSEDIAEIAERFDKFVKDVDQKKHAPGPYGQSHPPQQYPNGENPPDRTLAIYKECLEWLTKDDLIKLDIILKKLTAALLEMG